MPNLAFPLDIADLFILGDVRASMVFALVVFIEILRFCGSPPSTVLTQLAPTRVFDSSGNGLREAIQHSLG
jgi:hypothetical protein